MLRVQGHNS